VRNGRQKLFAFLTHHSSLLNLRLRRLFDCGFALVNVVYYFSDASGDFGGDVFHYDFAVFFAVQQSVEVAFSFPFGRVGGYAARSSEEGLQGAEQFDCDGVASARHFFYHVVINQRHCISFVAVDKHRVAYHTRERLQLQKKFAAYIEVADCVLQAGDSKKLRELRVCRRQVRDFFHKAVVANARANLSVALRKS